MPSMITTMTIMTVHCHCVSSPILSSIHMISNIDNQQNPIISDTYTARHHLPYRCEKQTCHTLSHIREIKNQTKCTYRAAFECTLDAMTMTCLPCDEKRHAVFPYYITAAVIVLPSCHHHSCHQEHKAISTIHVTYD